MDGEATVCSWYSSTLLLISALYWILHLNVLRERVERYTAAAMALTLTALSLDESISIHEAASKTLQSVTNTPFELMGPIFLAAIPALLLCGVIWRKWPMAGETGGPPIWGRRFDGL